MIGLNHQGKHRSHAPVHPDQRPDFFLHPLFESTKITFPLEAERNENQPSAQVFPETGGPPRCPILSKVGGSWLLPVLYSNIDTSGGAKLRSRSRQRATRQPQAKRRAGQAQPLQKLAERVACHRPLSLTNSSRTPQDFFNPSSPILSPVEAGTARVPGEGIDGPSLYFLRFAFLGVDFLIYVLFQWTLGRQAPRHSSPSGGTQGKRSRGSRAGHFLVPSPKLARVGPHAVS